MSIKISAYLKPILFIVLFAWISFFPQPIQEKYHFFTNLFLILIFLIFFARKSPSAITLSDFRSGDDVYTFPPRKHSSIFKLSDYPLWVFLIAINANVFFAQQRNIAFKTYLDLVIPMFCIYYLVSEGFSSEKSFELLAKTICICSILVSLGGILESLFAYNPLYAQVIPNPFYLRYITGFVRPMSTQFNPLALGTYLLASLPFNFLLFKQNKSLLRLLGAVGIVLNLVVIILTFSRGVFLGFIGMVVFYLFMQKRYRLLFIFFVILLLFIFLCSYLPYPFSRFGKEQMTTENRGALSNYRFTRCIMTARIIRDHPLAGLGFQHFRRRFYEYHPYKFKVPYEFMILDNMYLTILAETGIVGFLGFLIFIFSSFSRGLRYLRGLNNNPPRRLQLLMTLIAFVGLLINMGAYELFYWSNIYLYFCILVGCIGGFCKNRKGYDY